MDAQRTDANTLATMRDFALVRDSTPEQATDEEFMTLCADGNAITDDEKSPTKKIGG